MGRKKALGAGYRQRSDGRIEYRWTDVTGQRRSICARTLEKCEEKVRRKQADLEAGILSGRCTFAALCDQYRNMKRTEVKASTFSRYEALERTPRKIIGRMEVAKITPLTIDALAAEVRELHTQARAEVIMGHVRGILDYAVSIRLIQHSPAEHLAARRKKKEEDPNPITKTTHRALTDAELARFFGAARDTFYYNFFRFMLATGCRAGEAAALTAADVDTVTGTIRISKTVAIGEKNEAYIEGSPKNGHARTIGMSEDARRVLADQAAFVAGFFGKSKPIRLFPSTRGKLLTACIVNSCIRNLCKKAGIRTFSSHAFRHTFATRAVECGMLPHELQKHLGHTSIELTMNLYYHHSDEAAAAAAAKVRVPV